MISVASDKLTKRDTSLSVAIFDILLLTTRAEHFSQWEEMTSLAQAASQLLQHLLTEHQLAIQKRSLILCGLLRLLGRSLALAKQDSSASQSDCKGPKEGHLEGGTQGEIFKEAFVILRGSLEKLLQASGRLQFASEKYCHEEFQV